jgi:very-short-patch-repair endonuclease
MAYSGKSREFLLPVKEHEENRSAELDRLGITIIRFTNEQIMQNMETVLKEIISFVKALNRPTSPSP